MSEKILIVGCGFSGAVFARLAAEKGKKVKIIDKREHIGGNSYSYEDKETGIEVHKYGPHIFHTNSQEIWEFINRFSEFNNFTLRTKALTGGKLFTLPVNLMTINQFFNKTFSPTEAKKFIESLRIEYQEITNFEEFITSNLGTELYEAFYKNYTIKQWGLHPKDLNISTAKRLPIRYYYDDNYFNDKFQGIPVDGYTKIFERMLQHDNIEVQLNTDFFEIKDDWQNEYATLIYTGSIDRYFDFKFGKLPYRSLKFEEIRGEEIQGNAIINYTDLSVPYTRITEHKWFTPERQFDSSVAHIEYSLQADSENNPFYPIRNRESDALFNKYNEFADKEKNVIFLGRLAEFKYYDMHQVIASSIAKFKNYLKTSER